MVGYACVGTMLLDRDWGVKTLAAYCMVNGMVNMVK